MKKNQLSAMQQDLNNKMAELYNSKGKFPYTLLLDGHGNILRAWDGFTNEKPEEFISEIRNTMQTGSLSK
jgi:hypothetical protein